MANNINVDKVTAVIGVIANEDRESLIQLLKRNRYNPISEDKDTVLLLAMQAIKDSPSFRKDMAAYISSFADGNTSNAEGKGFLGGLFAKKEGGTGVGNAIRSIFSQENISSATQAGINALSIKLANDAAKKGNQQAIDLQRAQADTAAAQYLLAQQGGGITSAKSGTPGWVIPVVIGVGVILIGTVIFFAVRKK